MAQVYGTGADSTVGNQIRTDYFYKKALVEVAKETYFGQMADTISMPKHMGKTIKRYHYLPVLDDRNLNDQGIDANGAAATGFLYPVGAAGAATTKKVAYIKVVKPEFTDGAASPAELSNYENVHMYFRGDSTVSDADALLNAKAKVVAYFTGEEGVTVTDITLTADSYDEVVAEVVTGAATGSKWILTIEASTEDTNYGNFYGSSKDVGTIAGKLPALTENGGRVNRVGMRRVELEGTIEKFGLFTEYTQESLDFDTDSELLMHLTTEVTRAANEMTEDQLQSDLLNSAGVIRYPGSATSVATIDGNDATYANNDVVTYDDLVKLAIELDQNRCPKNTKLIAGSRMVDTKVVNAARYIYIGSELLPTLMRMTDYHGNKAWIPAAQYAQAGNVAKGEQGAIDSFRFIVVPEMQHWEGAGAQVTSEASLFRNNGLNYSVYPMLVVGDGAFTTIGFQTDGKSVKFKTKHVKPEQNYSREDPYGTTGFMSIQWWYGFMIQRPERIGLMYSLAEW